MSPGLFWVIAIIIFAVAEGISVGLVSIWFAVGALGGLITSFLTDNIWVQTWVFLILSLASLAAFKPLAARYMTKGKKEATNADRLIGKQAVVLEQICNLENTGQVQVFGQIWTARSVDDSVIPAETVVRICRMEGVKLYVSPDEKA